MLKILMNFQKHLKQHGENHLNYKDSLRRIKLGFS
jgi:hypothetical protein